MQALKKLWDFFNSLRESWEKGKSTALFIFAMLSDNIVKLFLDSVCRLPLPEGNCSEISVLITKSFVLFVAVLFVTIREYCRNSIIIEGDNYLIQVEYGNILEEKGCKRVIGFDECYTDHVGNEPGDINPDSLCGQYLKQAGSLDIKQLIERSCINPCESGSRYMGKKRFESGSIVLNGNDLLLAFAQLNEKGAGEFPSRKEYTRCLEKLWEEIDVYYGQQDVCIPALGAGVTRIGTAERNSLSQQEAVNMIIGSYKLSGHKIKKPYKLRIICRKTDDFSLHRIDSRI